MRRRFIEWGYVCGWGGYIDINIPPILTFHRWLPSGYPLYARHYNIYYVAYYIRLTYYRRRDEHTLCHAYILIVMLPSRDDEMSDGVRW